MNPRALQVLIPDGKPNGMKIIEIAGWSGKCFLVPRQNLKELKDRPEINQPGLYFLFGTNEEKGLVYIGESENFFSRVSNHNTNKEFWDVCVIFTGGLNRAHVKYLEYRATTLASEVNRLEIQNKVQLQENSLSEFEKVIAEQYFEHVQFTLSTLNYEIFEPVEESLVDETLYYLQIKDADAKAKILDNGNLVVLKDSLGRISETESISDWIKNTRAQLLKDKKIVADPEHKGSFKLNEDTVFKSPTAAAAAFAGRTINGWTAWKDVNGKTLDENLRN